MKKKTAVVLALLLTLVVLGTFVSIVTGWFNPVVKVTGNKITFANMEDNIDFCAAPLIYGEKTVEQLGTDLLNMVGRDRLRQADQGGSAGLYRNGHRPGLQLRLIYFIKYIYKVHRRL